MQNDESVKTLFNIKGEWHGFVKKLNWNIQIQPNVQEKLLLLPFPSSYLAECRFSIINDLLLKKKKKSAGYNTTGRLETEAN